jgi:FMN phosphatase YigB (HAD superfamily)
MFDLGGTLIDAERRAFPGVLEAVERIQQAGLKTCIVSDYDMSVSSRGALTVYRQILEGAGLLQLFEPMAKRVTLSNHAGVTKPDRRIFAKALERLGARSLPFSECMFITEDAGHVSAARDLGLQALRWGVDFRSWAEAPALLLGPGAERRWATVSVPGADDLQEIEVEVPDNSEEAHAEAQSFVIGLAANRKIAGRPGQESFGATHAIEQDASGKRKLIRKRFSAL